MLPLSKEPWNITVDNHMVSDWRYPDSMY